MAEYLVSVLDVCSVEMVIVVIENASCHLYVMGDIFISLASHAETNA